MFGTELQPCVAQAAQDGYFLSSLRDVWANSGALHMLKKWQWARQSRDFTAHSQRKAQNEHADLRKWWCHETKCQGVVRGVKGGRWRASLGGKFRTGPLHGLRKEYTEGNKSKCPKSKASSCYPRTEDTPGWLEKSKKKEREQTRMLTVKEAGAFVPKEQNLGFTLCVERSYWNVLNWEVICIF